MKTIKRAAFVLLAAILLLSFSGCGNTSWSAKYDGKTLKAGIYTYYMLNAYYQAANMVTDTQSDPLTQQVEGKDASEWIKEKTMQAIAIHFAAEKKAKEMNVSLTEEEKAAAVTETDSAWSQSKAMFEGNYIAKESLLACVESGKLQEKLFKAMYAKGGTEEISEATIRESYMSLTMISETLGTLKEPTPATEDAAEVPLTDEEKAENTKIEEKNKKIKDLFQELYTEFEKKTDENAFKDIYTLYVTKINEIRKDEENYTEKKAEDLPTAQPFPLKPDEEQEASLDEDMKKVYTGLREQTNDKAAIYETKTAMFFGVKADAYKDAAFMESYEMQLLDELKGEDFSKMLEDLAATFKESIVYNDTLVKRYSAKKLYFPVQ